MTTDVRSVPHDVWGRLATHLSNIAGTNFSVGETAEMLPRDCEHTILPHCGLEGGEVKVVKGPFARVAIRYFKRPPRQPQINDRWQLPRRSEDG